jgi:hypothetical protein
LVESCCSQLLRRLSCACTGFSWTRQFRVPGRTSDRRLQRRPEDAHGVSGLRRDLDRRSFDGSTCGPRSRLLASCNASTGSRRYLPRCRPAHTQTQQARFEAQGEVLLTRDCDRALSVHAPRPSCQPGTASRDCRQIGPSTGRWQLQLWIRSPLVQSGVETAAESRSGPLPYSHLEGVRKYDPEPRWGAIPCPGTAPSARGSHRECRAPRSHRSTRRIDPGSETLSSRPLRRRSFGSSPGLRAGTPVVSSTQLLVFACILGDKPHSQAVNIERRSP